MVRKQREKAEAGDPVAMYNMGQYYFHGIHGVGENRAEAARWFQLSADCGDEDGLSLLGWCFLGGWGVKEVLPQMQFHRVSCGPHRGRNRRLSAIRVPAMSPRY